MLELDGEPAQKKPARPGPSPTSPRGARGVPRRAGDRRGPPRVRRRQRRRHRVILRRQKSSGMGTTTRRPALRSSGVRPQPLGESLLLRITRRIARRPALEAWDRARQHLGLVASRSRRSPRDGPLGRSRSRSRVALVARRLKAAETATASAAYASRRGVRVRVSRHRRRGPRDRGRVRREAPARGGRSRARARPGRRVGETSQPSAHANDLRGAGREGAEEGRRRGRGSSGTWAASAKKTTHSRRGVASPPGR